MSDFDLKTGRLYRGEFSLGLLEQFADNEMIAAVLREHGFVNVEVTGAGAGRVAVGRWNAPDARVSLPAQVTSLEEVHETA